ncbi:hypothetical protein FGB62_82g051 [Gracilaria domingensis]|nr:hypothetical protein FGB62_82g051 [Gracilaria domingensis]
MFRQVNARLGLHSSIYASVCERNTGKGKVEFKKSAERHRSPPSAANLPFPHSPLVEASSELLKSKSKNKVNHHGRQWLFRLHRADANASLAVNVRDTEHGTVNMKLCSRKNVNVSVHLKRFITAPSFGNGFSLASRARKLLVLFPPCLKRMNSNSTGHLRFQHELEYKWNERFLSALYSIGAFQHVVSVRIRNNPLRITPKFEIPLWAGGNTAPCLTWEREPKSGPGEVQLMRKPFKISYESQRRRVGMYYFSKAGSISKLRFDTQSIQIEQTMTHLLKGAIVTTTSTLSSQASSTGVTISATAPWGKIAAHGCRQSAFLISSDAVFDCSRRYQLRAMFEAENLSRFAVRLGVFY